MDILQRGQSMVFVKKSTFLSYVFFFVKKATNKHFLIFWIEKKRKEYFLDHKRKVLKNCKKSTFCKGVSPWFFQKIDLFLTCFFFSKKNQKETLFDILDRKEQKRILFRPQKRSSKKLYKIDILQRGQFMVFVKKSTFFSFFF